MTIIENLSRDEISQLNKEFGWDDETFIHHIEAIIYKEGDSPIPRQPGSVYYRVFHCDNERERTGRYSPDSWLGNTPIPLIEKYFKTDIFLEDRPKCYNSIKSYHRDDILEKLLK